MESRERGKHSSKARHPGRSGIKSRQSPKTNLVVGTEKVSDVSSNCAKSHRVHPKVKTPLENCAPRGQTLSTCSLAKTSSELQTPNKVPGSRSRLAQRPKRSSQPPVYVTMLKEIFKPEKLTRLENRVKRRTVEALEKLNRNIEEVRPRQKQLLQDSWLLQEEVLNLETEDNHFLGFLQKQHEQCKKKNEDLWNQYFQECGKLIRKKQEMKSMFAKKNANLRKQLLEGKNTQSQLRQQFKSIKHIPEIKNQEMKIEMLQKEQENMKAETARKGHEAHWQLLEQKILLDKQLRELELEQGGTTQVLAKACRPTAQKVNLEFCLDVNRENQALQKEFVKLVQEYHRLVSIKRTLEKWKSKLKGEQWHQEALVRGRQQLKTKSERSHECAPKNRVSQGHIEPSFMHQNQE